MGKQTPEQLVAANAATVGAKAGTKKCLQEGGKHAFQSLGRQVAKGMVEEWEACCDETMVFSDTLSSTECEEDNMESETEESMLNAKIWIARWSEDLDSEMDALMDDADLELPKDASKTAGKIANMECNNIDECDEGGETPKSPRTPLSPVRMNSYRNILSKTRRIRNGALLFVQKAIDAADPFGENIQLNGEATIDWLLARGIKVEKRDTVMHVAMVVAESDAVVEAVPGKGVRIQTLVDFFSGYGPETRFFLGEVSGVSSKQADDAVRWAVAQADKGAEYADDFSAWTETDPRFYCSSLVDYAYGKASGQDNMFLGKEYTLLFEPRNWWENYYHERNMAMPSCTGTNPTLLLHSQKLMYSELIFSNGSKSPAAPRRLFSNGSESPLSDMFDMSGMLGFC